MEKQQPNKQDPQQKMNPTATAVPYDSNDVPVAVAVEAVAVPVPAASSANYGQQQPQVVQGQGGYVDIGTCRRCGQQFQRNPGVNNASAEFYRCPRCAKLHLEDFCLIS